MAYTIEEEQELNEIKNWWKENGKMVIAIFVLAFAGVFGWRYWQSHQIAQSQQRSLQYEQIVKQFQEDKGKIQDIEQFVQNNSKTAYAVFTLLDAAAVSVQNQDFSQAENLLKQALLNSDDDILQSLVSLRLALVQFQLKKFNDAMQTLNSIKSNSSWDSSVLLLKGDIQFALGEKEEAKTTFQEGLKKADSTMIESFRVRLNNY
ncbi:YfgM family protein [Avibacterium paragallinarum]|uniref:YfgM family protein n=2 Tax=Avibacterium paragallinarum TaxID=728 RepID=UPI0021F782DE|nr:YfgM family protein [Avibacterium paragallinarum]UXN34678.1 YfgM family protein [Avibacterium paragallinarum]